jgi:hypothetical protein
MLSSHFIKFALVAKPTASLHLVEWGHGPVHCFGGIELSFDTTQGTYWRPAALAAAEAIVHTCGGVVAEDRGVVRLIVPPEWSVEVHAKLAAVCRARTGHYDGTANEMALVSAGVGRLTQTKDHQGRLRLSMEPVTPRAEVVTAIEVTEAEDGRASVTVWTDSTSIQVRVPLDWATSSKQKWYTTASVAQDCNRDFDREAEDDEE